MLPPEDVLRAAVLLPDATPQELAPAQTASNLVVDPQAQTDEVLAYLAVPKERQEPHLDSQVLQLQQRSAAQHCWEVQQVSRPAEPPMAQQSAQRGEPLVQLPLAPEAQQLQAGVQKVPQAWLH
jgi:hypothetical protein